VQVPLVILTGYGEIYILPASTSFLLLMA